MIAELLLLLLLLLDEDEEVVRMTELEEEEFEFVEEIVGGICGGVRVNGFPRRKI